MTATLKVLALTRHGRTGPSSRLRILQFIPTLEHEGISVSVAALLTDAQLRTHMAGRRYPLPSLITAYARRIAAVLQSRHYDVLWVEKEMFPWLPGILESVPRLLKVPYVIDYDDATFHQYDLHPSPLTRRLLRTKVASLMRHAAVVVAGNRYLAAYATNAGSHNVVVLPTVVDMSRYPPRSIRARHRCLRIGWIGTPSTAQYLGMLSEPLRELSRRRDVKLVVVGALPPPLTGVPIEARTWREQSEVKDISTFDVGIMPLPDDSWASGKCGYKIIQYMASSVATVASPVGVNTDIVEVGMTGFLASTSAEWLGALETLGDNPTQRERFGARARQRVIDHYSITCVAPQLMDALRMAAQ